MRRIATALLASTLLAPVSQGPAAAEDVKLDQVTVAKSDPSKPRLYVADIAINHIVDGRMHVLDGETLDYQGLIGTGFTGQIYVPKAKDVVYVSTTYFPKLTRGPRTDFLEIYDTATLSLKDEIPIPTKRAQALNYRPLMQGSSDGRWMLIQNATPATSVTIVDLKVKRATGEVPNPGCYGIFPAAQPNRFSTLCGDGSIGTYTLNAAGSKADRKASPKIFDADKDALFLHGERDGDTWLFVSFQGTIYRIAMEGDTAKLVETVPMTADVEGGWRPGGYQPIAYDAKDGVLYALMHSKGDEGSHKNPAEEVWAFDVKAKKLLSRSPTAPATSLTISADGNSLYLVNPLEATILRFAVDKAADHKSAQAATAKVGEAAVQIEAN